MTYEVSCRARAERRLTQVRSAPKEWFPRSRFHGIQCCLTAAGSIMVNGASATILPSWKIRNRKMSTWWYQMDIFGTDYAIFPSTSKRIKVCPASTA